MRIERRNPWPALIALSLTSGIVATAGFLAGDHGMGLTVDGALLVGGVVLGTLLLGVILGSRSYYAGGPLVIDADGIRWNTDGHDRGIRWDSVQRVRLTGSGMGARIIVWYQPTFTPPKLARRGPRGSYLLLQPALYGRGPYQAVNEHIRQALAAFAGDKYIK
jgi:hypothetical protein